MSDVDSVEGNDGMSLIDDLKSESLMDFSEFDGNLKLWLKTPIESDIGSEDDFGKAEESAVFSENSGSSTSLFAQSSVGSSPEMKKMKLDSEEVYELAEDDTEPGDEAEKSPQDSTPAEGLTGRIMKWLTGWLRSNPLNLVAGQNATSN